MFSIINKYPSVPLASIVRKFYPASHVLKLFPSTHKNTFITDDNNTPHECWYCTIG